MMLRNSITYLIKVAFLSLVAISFTINAQAKDSKTINTTLGNIKMNKEFEILLVTNEENHLLAFQKNTVHNGIDVTLFRYQPAGVFSLNKQNISILQNQKGNLEGFVRLLPQYKDSNHQVSKDEAQTIAINFLKRLAPDLLEKYKVDWIGKHTEEIYDVDNKKIVVSGMKVKCRNEKDGLYFWVVIAQDKSVMIFERDVEWDFLRAGRKTEKWLHDSWLIKNM